MTQPSYHLSYAFSKKQRLLKSSEFKRVFDNPIKKIHSEHLLLFVQTGQGSIPSYPDGCSDMTARLGLAITKKKVKLAVMRNQIKRLAREYFRLNAHRLASVDVVLIVKKSCTKDVDLHSEMTQIFDKLTTLFPADFTDEAG